MTNYVALFRGINVGGARKVPMADLRKTFEALGHTNIATYIQSGNVVFSTPKPAAATRSALEARIERDFGHDVTVLLRTTKQLERLVTINPYGAAAHVTFLEAAAPKLARALDPVQYAPDVFTIAGTEVFVHCPNGYGRTKINNQYFERKLETRATTRNWNTVTTLLEMSGSGA